MQDPRTKCRMKREMSLGWVCIVRLGGSDQRGRNLMKPNRVEELGLAGGKLRPKGVVRGERGRGWVMGAHGGLSVKMVLPPPTA